MSILFSVYVLALFVVLTPGILLRLPKKGSKITVALVHALVFAAVLAVSGHVFWKHGRHLFEGMEHSTKTPGSNPGSNKQKATESKPNMVSSVSYADSKPNMVTSPSSKNPGSN